MKLLDNLKLSKFDIERLKLLRMWRQVCKKLHTIVKESLPDAEVYVFGSVTRKTYTILSDVDVLIVSNYLPNNHDERIKLKSRIRWLLWERENIPWWYPLDIHLVTKEEFNNYLKHVDKLLKVEDL